MGAKDVLVNLLGAMCLIALSPSLSGLPSVPTVSHFGGGGGVFSFAGFAAMLVYARRFLVLGGGVLSLPVCQAGRSHQ